MFGAQMAGSLKKPVYLFTIFQVKKKGNVPL
jgi:hypothetical protein